MSDTGRAPPSPFLKNSLRSPDFWIDPNPMSLQPSFGQDGSVADLAPSGLREEEVIFLMIIFQKGRNLDKLVQDEALFIRIFEKKIKNGGNPAPDFGG